MSQGCQRICIYEPRTEGHHLVYLRHVCEAFLAAGVQVTVACENRETRRERVDAEMVHLWSRVERVLLFEEGGRPLHDGKMRAASAVFRQSGADLLFFNGFDEVSSSLCRRAALGIFPAADLRGKMAGIFVRPRFLESDEASSFGNRWKRAGFERLMRKGWIRALFLLNERLVSELEGRFGAGRFQSLADPAWGNYRHGKSESRRALGLPERGFLLLQYGTASPRKGLPFLLRAMLQEDDRGEVVLVCAGECAKAAEASAEGRRLLECGRLVLLDRYVSQQEEEQLFCGVDAVALAYEGHYGSSGVLVRAAAAGCPVLATDEGLVGWRVRMDGLGAVFAPGDLAEFWNQLRGLKARSEAERVASAARLEAFAQMQSPQAFATVIGDFARSGFSIGGGLPSSDARRVKSEG